jgi:hypothetical protein
LTLSLKGVTPEGAAIAVELEAGLSADQGQWICLDTPQWRGIDDGLEPTTEYLKQLRIDLGPTVHLQTLQIETDQIVVGGSLQVSPA